MSKEPEIIFENEDILVINKPTGLMVHEDGVSKEPTVVDWFLKHVPAAHGIGDSKIGHDGNELERSGVVHRLDRDTSGVMVLAKNQESFWHLKKQFKDRLVKKEYRAIVYGKMRENRGSINRPIGRNAKDFRLRSAERGAKGTMREALTYWEKLSEGEYKNEPFTYLRLLPKTGRTHQLRVHLKAVGHPIVGDSMYAGKKFAQSNNLGLGRLALHSASLEVVLPDGGKQTFATPLPKELLAAVECIAPVQQLW